MPHVAKHPRHGGRRLLAGLHQEVLAVRLAVRGHGADGLHGAGVKRIGRVLRDKSAMRLHLRNAQQFGKIRCLAEGINPRGAHRGRDQPNGGRPAGEVPLEGAGANHFNGCRCQIELRQQIAEQRRKRGREVADVSVQRKEAVGEAEIVDTPEDRFGVAGGVDDQAHRHRLQRRRRGSQHGPKRIGKHGGTRRAKKCSSVHAISSVPRPSENRQNGTPLCSTISADPIRARAGLLQLLDLGSLGHFELELVVLQLHVFRHLFDGQNDLVLLKRALDGDRRRVAAGPKLSVIGVEDLRLQVSLSVV